VHYDPLLCKMVAWGETRIAATARLGAALRDTALLGVMTNLDFLADVLDHPAWREGRLHTGFLDEHFAGWPGERPVPEAAVAAALEAWSVPAAGGASADARGAVPSPWVQLGSWTPAAGKKR
jgi:acetyl/propionyl-CoA carboxylase alpha subunit